MKEVLLRVEGEGLSKQGECVWIGKGGGSFAVATLLGNIPGGNEATDR